MNKVRSPSFKKTKPFVGLSKTKSLNKIKSPSLVSLGLKKQEGCRNSLKGSGYSFTKLYSICTETGEQDRQKKHKNSKQLTEQNELKENMWRDHVSGSNCAQNLTRFFKTKGTKCNKESFLKKTCKLVPKQGFSSSNFYGKMHRETTMT